MTLEGATEVSFSQNSSLEAISKSYLECRGTKKDLMQTFWHCCRSSQPARRFPLYYLDKGKCLAFFSCICLFAFWKPPLAFLSISISTGEEHLPWFPENSLVNKALVYKPFLRLGSVCVCVPPTSSSATKVSLGLDHPQSLRLDSRFRPFRENCQQLKYRCP